MVLPARLFMANRKFKRLPVTGLGRDNWISNGIG